MQNASEWGGRELADWVGWGHKIVHRDILSQISNMDFLFWAFLLRENFFNFDKLLSRVAFLYLHKKWRPAGLVLEFEMLSWF